MTKYIKKGFGFIIGIYTGCVAINIINASLSSDDEQKEEK